jgi:hypothetical protein
VTPTQCVELCRYVRGAVPHQQWDATTPDVWFDLGLSDWSLADALAAVKVMVRSKVFVDFHGIVDTIRKIRGARMDGIDDRRDQFPGDPDDVHAELAWWQQVRTRVANGEDPDNVFGARTAVEGGRRVDEETVGRYVALKKLRSLPSGS